MAQQTAVEWFAERLTLNGLADYLTVEEESLYNKLKEQAKEMEKKQKKRAWVDGNGTQMCITSKDVDECFDDYYNENYKSE
jgi:hypothetical protein